MFEFKFVFEALSDKFFVGLIETADQMSDQQIENYGLLAKRRIEDSYRWESIVNQYQELFHRESDALGKVKK